MIIALSDLAKSIPCCRIGPCHPTSHFAFVSVRPNTSQKSPSKATFQCKQFRIKEMIAKWYSLL
jgi:hypothetical protein